MSFQICLGKAQSAFVFLSERSWVCWGLEEGKDKREACNNTDLDQPLRYCGLSDVKLLPFSSHEVSNSAFVCAIDRGEGGP